MAARISRLSLVFPDICHTLSRNFSTSQSPATGASLGAVELQVTHPV
jgi:hypothetical protein